MYGTSIEQKFWSGLVRKFLRNKALIRSILLVKSIANKIFPLVPVLRKNERLKIRETLKLTILKKDGRTSSGSDHCFKQLLRVYIAYDVRNRMREKIIRYEFVLSQHMKFRLTKRMYFQTIDHKLSRNSKQLQSNSFVSSLFVNCLRPVAFCKERIYFTMLCLWQVSHLSTHFYKKIDEWEACDCVNCKVVALGELNILFAFGHKTLTHQSLD